MRTVRLAAGLAAAAILMSSVAAHAQSFPDIIPLPNGWRPEGIVSGNGTEFYVGSLANGAIYKGDYRTGQGGVLVPGQTGRVTVGLSFDKRSGYLFAAGGGTGQAFVFDTRTGQELASYALAGQGNFVNDVIVTREAAYFTNSFAAVLYKLPLSGGGGLPDPSQVQTLPLSGEWVQSPGFNANGIEATPNGKTLIVVNSGQGALYKVDPNTGAANRIDLGGEVVTAGDGLLLDGKTLYVMRNQLNLIAVVRLSNDYTSGQVVGGITNPAFRVPTTLADFGNVLYAVNARFGVPNPGEADYDIVRVPKQ